MIIGVRDRRFNPLFKASMITSQLCFPGMRPFTGDPIFRCPWLEFSKSRQTNRRRRGVLLMQDWGAEDEKFDDALELLNKCANGEVHKDADRTLNNLFSKDSKLGQAIADGEILVTNAVWGLREGKSKCGYLGARTHKAAFVNWGKLVSKVAAEIHNDDFCLYVAGSWAEFDGCGPPKKTNNLQDYLKKWQKWASRGHGKVDVEIGPLEKCLGQVVYLYHPCLWNVKGVCKDSCSE